MYRKLLCSVLLMILALGLICTDSASARLVGWWKLDEKAGTTAVDASGSGNAGTLVNGPVWAAGQVDGAVRLDGSDDYVELPIGTLLSGLTNSTFTIWANWAQQGGAWQRLWDFGTSSSAGYMFLTPNVASATGVLRFAITQTSNGGEQMASAGATLPTGWHHVTVTIDADNTDHTLWLDGEVVARNTNANLTPSSLGVTPNNWLGRSQWPDPYYNGSLDDFRIYNEVLTQKDILEAMTGAGPVLGIAGTPNPGHNATDVVRDSALIWAAGPYAKTHDVYLGTSFDDVNNAGTASPLLVSKGQEATTYVPTSPFDFGQTYFWRVDEINAPDKPGIYKGKTWAFTAETYGYPITTTIKATASSYSNTLTQPSKTIDGSGLTGDQHSTSASTMWMSKKNVTPIWIQYEFDQVYSLHQMWVWNQNQLMELDNGYGAKTVTIEVSTDGTTWTALDGVPEFAQATAEETYEHNTTVDFGGVAAKFVKLNIIENWGGLKQAGLAEVRFYSVPQKAFVPAPAAGATDVPVTGVLDWRPGRTTVSSEVYFGMDPNALSKVGTVTGHTYSLTTAGAEYDRTYYWKVDEVDAAAAKWPGDVWSFSTPSYLVVEDFESYDNYCGKIFYTWVDGYGASTAPECGGATIPGNGTGSSVGNQSAPYAERTNVHGGKQSMPLYFDNPGATSVSETTRTFTVPRDWVQGGMKTLVLFFRGAADNPAAQLYVKINNTKVTYNGYAQALTLPLWKQWNIDLSSVAGNLRSVTSLTIGISGAGKGLVLFDDIQLYRAAPAVPVPVDPGTMNRMAYYAMEGDVKDGSGHGYNGTLVADPVFTNGAAGFGQALLFDGVNDHVELPIGKLIVTLTNATFATWANFDSGNANNWQRLFDFGSGTTNYLFLCPRTGTNNSGALRFAIRRTTSTAESQLMGPTMLQAGWHHVAVVFDAGSMNMKLYVDGTVMASGPTLVLPKDLGETTNNWLGRSQYTADGYYTGLVDDFRIFNRALTAGEIRFLAGDKN